LYKKVFTIESVTKRQFVPMDDKVYQKKFNLSKREADKIVNKAKSLGVSQRDLIVLAVDSLGINPKIK